MGPQKITSAALCRAGMALRFSIHSQGQGTRAVRELLEMTFHSNSISRTFKGAFRWSCTIQSTEGFRLV